MAPKRQADLHVENAKEYRTLIDTLGLSKSWEGGAANYRARRIFRRAVVDRLDELLEESQKLPIRKRPKFALGTVVDRRWWTSDLDFEFQRQSATALVRNFLAGTNFLEWWEFGAIRNHRGGKPPYQGTLITPIFTRWFGVQISAPVGSLIVGGAAFLFVLEMATGVI